MSFSNLSLALLSRQIIDALLDLVRSGRRVRLDAVLPEAIDTLEAVADSRNAPHSPARTRIVNSYQQVRLIHRLNSPEEQRAMLLVLSSLETARTTQRAGALRAIEFFYKIENRALRNCRLITV